MMMASKRDQRMHWKHDEHGRYPKMWHWKAKRIATHTHTQTHAHTHTLYHFFVSRVCAGLELMIVLNAYKTIRMVIKSFLN